MNDKITKQHIYSELVIRLDKLEYMLEKVLTSLESKTVNNVSVSVTGDCSPDAIADEIGKIMICTACMLGGDREHSKEYCSKRPPQWPNESYIDYMKRIGELNTAQSDEEAFREECK